MKTHPYEEWIEPYVTGDLPPRRRERMETHLATCARCRAAVARLGSIRTEAGRLRRSIEPAVDLWPEIAARLEPRRSGRGSGGRRLVPYAAAAAALLALASVLWWAGPGVSGGARAGLADGGDVRLEGALRAFGPTESAYREAASVLEESYAESAVRLEPETAAAIDRNLRILDAAIGEAREAVATRPDDPEAVEILAGRYRDKVEALRRLARISAPEPELAPSGGTLR